MTTCTGATSDKSTPRPRCRGSGTAPRPRTVCGRSTSDVAAAVREGGVALHRMAVDQARHGIEPEPRLRRTGGHGGVALHAMAVKGGVAWRCTTRRSRRRRGVAPNREPRCNVRRPRGRRVANSGPRGVALQWMAVIAESRWRRFDPTMVAVGSPGRYTLCCLMSRRLPPPRLRVVSAPNFEGWRRCVQRIKRLSNAPAQQRSVVGTGAVGSGGSSDGVGSGDLRGWRRFLVATTRAKRSRQCQPSVCAPYQVGAGDVSDSRK